MKIAKINSKNQAGFTLVEIMVGVVVVMVITAIAIIGFTGVFKAHKDADLRNRLLQAYEAQVRFRTTLRKGRFGALCTELKQIQTPSGPLIPDSVARFEGEGKDSCDNPVAVNGWVVTDDLSSKLDDAQIEQLQETFIIYARPETSQKKNEVQYCVAEDGIVRVGTTRIRLNPGCNRNSPPAE